MTPRVVESSLWWDTLPPDLLAPLGRSLEGDTSVDVAIVGAGYTGLWTAYYLLRTDPTLRIAIIEAQVAGFGASGRNGGWASALFPTSLEALARASSREAAIRMRRAMFATVTEIGRVAEVENWDIKWNQGGTVVMARTPLQKVAAQREIANLRSWGFTQEDYRLLDAKETSAIVGATDVLGATFTPHCAAINPALLVRNLARTVEAMGAHLYEGTSAISIAAGVVKTTDGEVRAEVIVRATEGYTRTLKGHTRTLAPIYSLMLSTEPLSEEVWASIGLASRETFSDGRHLIIYGQRTSDDRLVFGGRGAPYHFASRITTEQDQHRSVHSGLWSVLTELFPILAKSHVTHTWGGPLGVPRDWWASCGFDPSTGLAWAGGYIGDGVATSNLAGRTLTDLIISSGEIKTELTTLPWVGHQSPRWEWEPLRWIGVNLGLRTMMHADRHENRTGKPSRLAARFARTMGH